MSNPEGHPLVSPPRQLRARLAAFDRHSDDLLAMLRKVCERRLKPKSFDEKTSRRYLKFMAQVYVEEEVRTEQKRMIAPAADRAELLDQLGTDLGESRCKLDAVMQDDIRGQLFLAWCEAHGNPDLTDPVVGLFDANFDKVVGDVVAGLAALEAAAFRAAEQVRQEPGRPAGTGILPNDFIISLEAGYRDITGKRGGAGPGPFAQFAKKFLEALGRESPENTVIDAIKDARTREEKHPVTSRWGRSLFGGIGGKIPSSSQ